MLHLDLEADLPVALAGSADVVFNHTTLEHVFNVQKAAETLARLTRDIVIVIVPAAQEEHSSDSYGDYWRFMSVGLRRLFECQGLQPLLLISSPIRDCAIYHLLVASRYPERWRGHFPVFGSVNKGHLLFRESLLERLYMRLIEAVHNK